MLLRELAWHAQQSLRGGMDARTRTLLRDAIRRTRGQAMKADSPEARRTDSGPGDPRVRAKRPGAQLQPGMKLVRTWHGAAHEVTVIGDGKRFEYRGEVYRSLTQIARVITGTHWSGPRFFGLHRVGAVR